MKTTKMKQFKIDPGSYERNKAEQFLASIPKEDLIEAKTEQKAYTHYENILTIIYQDEEQS